MRLVLRRLSYRRALLLATIASLLLAGFLLLSSCSSPDDRQTPETREDDSRSVKRKDALEQVLGYELKKNLGDTEEGTSLGEAFEHRVEMNLAVPQPGWFSVEEINRIVVGWKGSMAGYEHLPQWQVKDGEIIALNGKAKNYTPELEEEFRGVIDASPRDKKLWARFDKIMTEEVEPEYSRKIDEATEAGGPFEEVNEWYEQAEADAVAKVGGEFGLTAEQTEAALSAFSSAEARAGEEHAAAKGKILNEQQIDILIDLQGQLP